MTVRAPVNMRPGDVLRLNNSRGTQIGTGTAQWRGGYGWGESELVLVVETCDPELRRQADSPRDFYVVSDPS